MELSHFALSIPLAAFTASAVQPVVILFLCVAAGIGTVLLLPGKREASFRAIGGVILAAMGLIFAALLIKFAANSPEGGMSVYFWAFAAIALFGAVRVVTHPRPVYAALYFILTVFASAGLFILLWAEFMAAALVLIYAGAILITYVFVIMLAAQSTSTRSISVVAEYDTISREPIAAAAVGFALMGVLLFVIFDKAAAMTPAPLASNAASVNVDATPVVSAAPADAGTVLRSEPAVEEGNTQQLGLYMFNHQLINVQLSGLLLTLGMVGAILIARKRVVSHEPAALAPAILNTPATPVDDNPYSIPVVGTDNPRAKAYPET
jgi:NADH-quinone oxidoreductase subunit J